MVACISIQEKDGGGLEQGENRGGDGVMLDFAYILMAEQTGLVKGQNIQCKGSDSNCGHTVSVAATQFCPSMNVAVDDK